MKDNRDFTLRDWMSLRGGGGGTMLFHAFRVVYTVKELDSHAKHGQSFKIQFEHITAGPDYP